MQLSYPGEYIALVTIHPHTRLDAARASVPLEIAM